MLNNLRLMWYEFISNRFAETAGLQYRELQSGQVWFATEPFINIFYDTDNVNALILMCLQGYEPVRFVSLIPTISDQQNQPMDWFNVNCIEFSRMQDSTGILVNITVTVKSTRRIRKAAKKQRAFKTMFITSEPFLSIEFDNVKYTFNFI